MSAAALSRRAWLTRWTLRRPRPADTPSPSRPAAEAPPAALRVAVIQGRFCLALTSFCRTCLERCPVPGALALAGGMPQVQPAICTGCGVCHDVCPAPRQAVLLLPRRPPPAGGQSARV